MSKKDTRLEKLSAQYESETGKQGLLYVYAPEGRKRYVFTDKTCLSYESAIKHILAKLSDWRDRNG